MPQVEVALNAVLRDLHQVRLFVRVQEGRDRTKAIFLLRRVLHPMAPALAVSDRCRSLLPDLLRDLEGLGSLLSCLLRDRATAELLTERCTLGLRNDTRLKARRCYPLPKVPAMRTPQLDGFIKGEVSTATRNADKELARLQSLVLDSLVLDSLAPLTHLLETEQRGGPPTWEEAKKAAVAAPRSW